MKPKKLMKSLAAVFMAGSLMAGFSVPAFADTVDTTPVNGTTTTIAKYLTMDKNANVPSKSFSFSIAPLTAEEVNKANTNSENLSIRPGLAGAVIGSADFAPGQNTVSLASPAEGDREAAIYVTAEEAANMKYAKSDITVDFTNVTFTEPGVYRYKITEAAANAEDGIYVPDENDTRYLDVYVESDEEGALSVQGYSLHTNNTAPVSKEDSAYTDIDTDYDAENSDADYKDQGFTNRFLSHDLILSKEVSGNQAYRGEYFCFTVVISGDTEGTVYNVDLSKADETGSINITDDTGKTYLGTRDFTNPTSLTIGEDGTITGMFYLKHGQEIAIRGLKYATAYSVTEAEKDYTASISLTEGENESETISANTTGDRTMPKADAAVSYTNVRSGAVPTGVFMNYGRYIAAFMATFMVFGLVLIRNRKRRLEK